MEALVHHLGERAAETSDGDERMRLYGELIATCAACHLTVRGGR